MTRDERRLKVVQRQLTLARVGQREAMVSLADALAREQRSAQLADRSEALAADYARRAAGAEDGARAETLTQLGRFTGALGKLSREASEARADAGQQAQWQMEALGKAQTRARRLEEHEKASQAKIRAQQAEREARAQAGAPVKGSPGTSPRSGGSKPQERLARELQLTSQEQARKSVIAPEEP